MRLVVGAILVDRLDAPTRVLAARRVRPAGRWEFPGGKVEPGESPQDALRRELREELRAEIRIGSELEPPEPTGWPLGGDLTLRLWLCTLTSPDLRPLHDHDQLSWVAPADLDQLAWMDGDRAAVQVLRARFLRPPPP